MWRDPSRRNQNFQVRYVMSDGWGEPVQINRRPHRKMAFSDYEKEQLRESIGFLTLAFALVIDPANGIKSIIDDPSILITTLPLAFAAVMTGFLLHELAHKWMAQQYGCWAEYRGNKNGLYFALAMSAFGFLLAAPGAVMVSGRITDRQNGIIAAVGPLTNIAIAIVALPIYIFTAGLDWPLSLLGELARFIIIINLILGGFNMIPVQPLDGSKVIMWSKTAYLGIIAAIFALAMVYWNSPVLG
uniref:Peptidase M50 n=1 Tax=uncultured marine group II/III euryarchaeote AD1000_49_E05 TaxID=1457779 RepID=A0A075FSF2_9EURY|nr:peptidase M50 [uncultured marine group II/III euryarchaeote AD1000_49_E05]